MSARILVLPGTTRPGAPDHCLAFEAARRLSITSATVTVLNLADYPLPLLDAGDAAAEPPPQAVQLAERLAAQDALLLASPDANDSLPSLPKNAIDWVSRVDRLGNRPLRPFRGLVVGLASASPGAFGGFPALLAWRQVFLALGAEVIGKQATVAGGAGAFDEAGRFLDADASDGLESFVADLADKAQALGRHQP